MCGIVGISGNKKVSERLLQALKKLEYRGYDSAGIATLKDGKRDVRKAVGKLRELEKTLKESPLEGNIGIAHTRWATHGEPTLENSHPHISGSVSVVHNGIVENFAELKNELLEKGFQFCSETDTETIAVQINHLLQTGLSPKEAFSQTIARLEGAFALSAMIEGDHTIYAARQGAPLAIGHGDGENYLGSDSIALADFCDHITYLDEGDWAIITSESVEIFNALGDKVEREVKLINTSQLIVDKGRHRHFMAKEIHDQPSVLANVLAHYLSVDRKHINLERFQGLDFKKYDRIIMVACGTAHYATFVAKYWVEEWAQMPCDVEIASEFRYREPPINNQTLVVLVSQSGETADTLAALHYAKSRGATTLGLVNSEESTISRECDILLPLKAGIEVSVASTKAFTSQLIVLAVFAIALAKTQKTISSEKISQLIEELVSTPRLISEAITCENQIETLAYKLYQARGILFLGRGKLFPIALEGALKLKELTYIQAEGYASGELKHGPIALIDENLPVIVFGPHDRLIDKSVSNMQEVAARSGQIFFCTDEKGLAHASTAQETIILPEVPESIAPIVYTIPAQLIAYYTAIAKGTDVDQPRNLAKSVTVE